MGRGALDVADEPYGRRAHVDGFGVDVEVLAFHPHLFAAQQAEPVAAHGSDRPDRDHPPSMRRNREDFVERAVSREDRNPELRDRGAHGDLDDRRRTGPGRRVGDRQLSDGGFARDDAAGGERQIDLVGDLSYRPRHGDYPRDAQEHGQADELHPVALAAVVPGENRQDEHGPAETGDDPEHGDRAADSGQPGCPLAQPAQRVRGGRGGAPQAGSSRSEGTASPRFLHMQKGHSICATSARAPLPGRARRPPLWSLPRTRRPDRERACGPTRRGPRP